MLKLKIFEQTKSGYCGPASLLMVMDFYGFKTTEKELVKRCKTTVRKGASGRNLVAAIKSFDWHGFWKEDGKIAELEYFIRSGRPIIIDWYSEYEGHYSVIIGIDKKYVYLADPETGKINRLLLERFKTVWFDFEGPLASRTARWHIGWMLVPSPDKLEHKINGHYF
jgi:predicted double-glycine peptidase